MSTPLEAGYSVLGWNHPGFYGSTGTPLPAQVNGICVVNVTHNCVYPTFSQIGLGEGGGLLQPNLRKRGNEKEK
jgi:hypothetical protein